jgi:hypothetical protein
MRTAAPPVRKHSWPPERPAMPQSSTVEHRNAAPVQPIHPSPHRSNDKKKNREPGTIT